MECLMRGLQPALHGGKSVYLKRLPDVVAGQVLQQRMDLDGVLKQ